MRVSKRDLRLEAGGALAPPLPRAHGVSRADVRSQLRTARSVVRGLLAVALNGKPGETYNIGGSAERANIDVVEAICALMDEMAPDSPHRPHGNLVTYVTDRPGHDARYAMDTSKIERELNWHPEESFESGLRKTVLWYLENRTWWQHIRSGSYRGERLGILTT